MYNQIFVVGVLCAKKNQYISRLMFSGFMCPAFKSQKYSRIHI